MLSRIVVALSCSGLLACGSIVDAENQGQIDASTQEVDADLRGPCELDEVPLENLGECYQRAFCGNIVRCSGVYDDIDECTQRLSFALFLNEGFSVFSSFVAEGTTTYDGAAARECFDAFANDSTCNLDLGGTEACERVFAGNLAEGQTCFSDIECGVGGNCVGSGDIFDPCMAGVCQLPAPRFGDCNGRSCEPGLHCVENPITMMRSCQSGEAGAPCRSISGSCDPGLFCNAPSDAQLGSCVPQLGDGMVCTSDDMCGPGLECFGDDSPGGSGTCGSVSAVGDPCDSECSGPLHCQNPGPSGTCQELPGMGEDCSVVTQISLFGDCNSPDLYCGPLDTCVPRTPEGMACSAFDECSPPASCVNDVCRAPLFPGDSCSVAADACITGCDAGTCFQPTSCY